MDDRQLDAWYEEATKAGRENREAVTVEILARYVVHRPNHAHAWYILGDSLRVVGRRDEARGVLTRAEGMAPKERAWLIHVCLAKLERDCGSHDRAEDWFRRAAESAEGREVGWVWIERGINLAAAGRFAEAERCHRLATKLPVEDCDRDEAWLNVGLVMRAQRRYVEAAAAFREACALDAEWPANREALESLDGMDDVLKRLKAFDD